MALKLSMNHRSDDCAWLNAPRRHHEAAERNLAAEIQWRRNEYGSHYRDPAKAGGDPGEIGVTPMTMRRVAASTLPR